MSACMNQIKSIEEEVLLQCLRDPQNYSFETSFDLQSFQTLCEYHRIRPQLYEMLKNNKTTPPDLLAYLKTHREQWTFRNLAFMAEAKKLKAAFSKADIDIIFYKGGLLSQEIYGDFSIRESCDLDIIVPPNRLIEVGDLLSKLGYNISRDSELWGKELFFELESEINWFHQDKDILIDLHWKLNHPRHCFDISYNDCLSHSKSLILQSTLFKVLEVNFSFFVLCLHRLKDPTRRLCHLLDLQALLICPEFSNTKALHHFVSRSHMTCLAKNLYALKIINKYDLAFNTDEILVSDWEKKYLSSYDLDLTQIKDSVSSYNWLKSTMIYLHYHSSNHESYKRKFMSIFRITALPTTRMLRIVCLKKQYLWVYLFIKPPTYLYLLLKHVFKK